VTNNVGQPQGEELGCMKPLSNSSFNCVFNSANSLGVILYYRLDIGVIPGCSSMVNSASRFSGILASRQGIHLEIHKQLEYLPGSGPWYAGLRDVQLRLMIAGEKQCHEWETQVYH
jgi:hypothetical protein